jgi:hypothetical protein
MSPAPASPAIAAMGNTSWPWPWLISGAFAAPLTLPLATRHAAPGAVAAELALAVARSVSAPQAGASALAAGPLAAAAAADLWAAGDLLGAAGAVLDFLRAEDGGGRGGKKGVPVHPPLLRAPSSTVLLSSIKSRHMSSDISAPASAAAAPPSSQRLNVASAIALQSLAADAPGGSTTLSRALWHRRALTLAASAGTNNADALPLISTLLWGFRLGPALSAADAIAIACVWDAAVAEGNALGEATISTTSAVAVAVAVANNTPLLTVHTDSSPYEALTLARIALSTAPQHNVRAIPFATSALRAFLRYEAVTHKNTTTSITPFPTAFSLSPIEIEEGGLGGAVWEARDFFFALLAFAIGHREPLDIVVSEEIVRIEQETKSIEDSKLASAEALRAASIARVNGWNQINGNGNASTTSNTIPHIFSLLLPIVYGTSWVDVTDS